MATKTQLTSLGVTFPTLTLLFQPEMVSITQTTILNSSKIRKTTPLTKKIKTTMKILAEQIATVLCLLEAVANEGIRLRFACQLPPSNSEPR